MQIGLKNALDIIDSLSSTVNFAVNEQCAQLSECDRYNAFLATGKPVFHIEYPTPLNTAAAKGVSCTGPSTAGMSTILKNMALDGPAVYCDGSQVDTPTVGGTSPPRPTKTHTPRPTSTRPTSTRPGTTRPTTTPRPTTSPTHTTPNLPPPTSSSSPGGPGNGCKSKHWDQCGGNNWNGCTVCEVRHPHFPALYTAVPLLTRGSCSRRIHAKAFRRRIITSAYKRGNGCAVYTWNVVLWSKYTRLRLRA